MYLRLLVTVFVVVACASGRSVAANLVANASFEEVSLTPWVPFASAATLSRSTVYAHSGSASVHVVARTHFYGGPSQNLAHSLIPGRRYVVSAWVRMLTDSNSSLSLNIKRVVGNAVTYTNVDSIQTSHQRWVKLSGSYDYSPSGLATEVSVYVMGPEPAYEFLVDDVSMEPFPTYVTTPATAADFVRRDGTSLVVGDPPAALRLLGVNFNAYSDEDENADTVFRGHDFDIDVDFQRVADLGGNVVRLNLWWKLFENGSAPYTYKPEGWAWLERILVAARAAGVRLILDMHAPQGGFQGPTSTSAYWSSPSLQARHEALLVALASRYKDEPYIAAYDILNEPLPPTDAVWQVRAAALVSAIRAVDQNHLIIVEQSFADDYAPFVLADPNLLYEFHWYERWRYTSQLSYPNGAGDYGISYPDAAVTIPPYDDVAGDLVATAIAPTGTSAWTETVGTPFVVSNPQVFGGVPVAWATGISGKLWVDDLRVEELDSNDNIVRTVTSVDIEKKPTQWWFLDEYEPFHSFTSDWAGSALSGIGSWGVESSGHRGSASLSIRSASGTYTVGSHKLLFALKQGHRYRIRGWVKTDSLSGSGGLGIRLHELAAWESFQPFTKASLETSLMAEGLSFYSNAGVPVNIGEVGQSPRNFTPGRGNGQWARDMLDLFETHNVSVQWFDWHSSNFGAYTNTLGFPEPIGANQPLLDILAQAFGGPGLPNLIAIAGKDQRARLGTTVGLDATGTVGTVVSWLWEQTAGDAVVLGGAATAQPSFVAPSSAGLLTFKLTVMGPAGQSEDTVAIEVFEPCPQTFDATGCIDAYSATVSVDERRPGSEKLKVQWKGFTAPTSMADFGDPVLGSSRYALCLYVDDGLAAELVVDRAAGLCNGAPCWKESRTGLSYKDNRASADGIRQVSIRSGAAGAGSVKISGNNRLSQGLTSLPVGTAAALAAGSTQAMQVRVSDGRCVSSRIGWIATRDGTRFSGGR